MEETKNILEDYKKCKCVDTKNPDICVSQGNQSEFSRLNNYPSGIGTWEEGSIEILFQITLCNFESS